jgi:hypothetical protein
MIRDTACFRQRHVAVNNTTFLARIFGIPEATASTPGTLGLEKIAMRFSQLA